jgi:hypothetical protein
MVDNVTPIPPAARPLNRDPFDSGATRPMPSSANMNNSGDASERVIEETNGIMSANATAPKMDPASDETREAPIARAASPRRAIG